MSMSSELIEDRELPFERAKLDSSRSRGFNRLKTTTISADCSAASAVEAPPGRKLERAFIRTSRADPSGP